MIDRNSIPPPSQTRTGRFPCTRSWRIGRRSLPSHGASIRTARACALRSTTKAGSPRASEGPYVRSRANHHRQRARHEAAARSAAGSCFPERSDAGENRPARAAGSSWIRLAGRSRHCVVNGGPPKSLPSTRRPHFAEHTGNAEVVHPVVGEEVLVFRGEDRVTARSVEYRSSG